MILTSTFMKHTKDWKVDKRVINISSAQEKSLFRMGRLLYDESWCKYVYTVRSNRRSRKRISSKIVAFAPGVVDTNMQAQIRETNKEDFTNLDRFIALKEEGKLLSPEYVAKAIRNLLETENFPQGEVIRIDE